MSDGNVWHFFCYISGVILSNAKDLITSIYAFRFFGQSPQQLVFTTFRMTRKQTEYNK